MQPPQRRCIRPAEKEKAILRVVGFVLALLTGAVAILASQSGKAPIPATDISAADIEATKQQAIAKKITDIPIRTVDAGGHNVGLGVVRRPKGTNLTGGASHDQVAEVYHILEESGPGSPWPKAQRTLV